MLLQFVSFKLAQLGALLALPQFDVSSQLLLPQNNFWDRLKLRLLTWDTVYYVSLAESGGPRYEHEWAFSAKWAELVRAISGSNDLGKLSLTSSLIAIISHFTGCIFIYMIARVLGKPRPFARRVGGLYVLCPAGIFLTAGYPESTFAMISFVGILLYLEGHFVMAGCAFGLASLLRSNGLLWGILFLYALFSEKRPAKTTLRIIIGGSIIGCSFLYPQYLAYKQFCPGRPWCDQALPLIYGFVQKEYWNNGFMRYWTPNNIANFLFAFPTLTLLARSITAIPMPFKLVQGVLLVGAIFFWHVQIVTRIASCLPGPYLYLAEISGTKEYKIWVSYFIIWGIVQAALFGGFLPPA